MLRDDSQAIVGIPEVIAAVERSLEVFPAADAEVELLDIGRMRAPPTAPDHLHPASPRRPRRRDA